jgi:hypothetical protein
MRFDKHENTAHFILVFRACLKRWPSQLRHKGAGGLFVQEMYLMLGAQDSHELCDAAYLWRRAAVLAVY